MNKITRESLQDHRKAASSPAAAAVQELAVTESLTPNEAKLLQSVLEDTPELSPEKALAMLREAGA